ncbi:hypothetical protein Dtox_3043 [Desulfofarcimen acetoxidans DSM 771]|jgi:F0F1-type ATP synthase membrane subunit b/b'|uniref:Uncharacterized protein n=1 Tax=Desulfofarcimen acetoxidans (strain ATCC 49208 / DSM 771 / KCTC 5769 / VKM B-1644 / 5575) TaxID=485916 RepID=C8W3K9_DESAS|nr:hypothetical protein [Desulfofarcimen acetoxidans]ACV63795.1 hypothetical protein Dtox_3043 [Desulfofarcimen acetoxidans DSM 771]
MDSMNTTFFAQIFNFIILMGFISAIYFSVQFIKSLSKKVNSIEKKLDDLSKK